MADRFRDDPEAQRAVEALPFVEYVDESRVYFTPITMADYTVRGIYVNLRSGTLLQTWQETANAPHPHVLDDDGNAIFEEYDADLCANTNDIELAIARGNWLAAVTAALCIAATYTYEDAPHNVPEAVTCELCGKAGNRSGDEMGITYLYHRNSTRYCHYKCYDELYDKLKGKKPDDDIPF